jgi:environmental stress-induced protein Ves
MNWSLASLEQAAAQPWRNGGGLTRELLAWPSATRWRVRMSVADVQAAGPFSRFDGVERWFAVLEGEGVALRLEQETHRLTRASEPLRFDGAVAVDCALLAGPTRDFNLMAPPGAARMQRVRGDHDFATSGAGLLAVYAHEDAAEIMMDGAAFPVPAFHLAWRLQQAHGKVRLRAHDALWMEVRT